MMKHLAPFTFIIFFSVFGCIKDDFINDEVEPRLQINNAIDTIALNTTFQFESSYFNNVGEAETISAHWESSQPGILNISEDGLAEALQYGSATITAEYQNGSTLLKDMIEVVVGDTTVSSAQQKTGTITSTSSYTLTGDFVINQDGDDLILEIADNYEASTALPGLYVYLTNNRNSTANAFEVGKVEIFSGAHSYQIPNVEISEYTYVLYFCKPFNVKVGDGQIL